MPGPCSIMIDSISSTSWQAGGESQLAMELWWRSAALEALRAFTVRPLRACPPAEQSRLQKQVAALLHPTLAAVMTSAALQVTHFSGFELCPAS